MALAVVFRFREREYYKELSNGEEVSFGCHKKDTIQIPQSKEHMLWLKAMSDEVQAAADAPLNLHSGILPCNELIVLSRTMEATIYISRVRGRGMQSVTLPYRGRVTVGRHPDNDIAVSYPIISGHHFQLLLEAGQVHVQDLNSTNGLYLNGRRISRAVMKHGDILSIFTFRFVLENGILYFENIGSSVRISAKIDKRNKPVSPETVMPKNAYKEAANHKAQKKAVSAEKAVYPQYQLSPRIREQLPHETIVLSGAPGRGASIGSRRSNFAYLLSSGAMMAASLATGMITPAALLMRAAGMISPIANMAMYSKMSKEEKKQLEEYEKMRQERYQAYIDSQKARIRKVADVQRRIITDENPAPAACMDTVKVLRRNLWERMPSDSDFLTVRLGIGKDKLCVEVKSRANVDGFSMADDELEELAGQIIEETRYVENIPVRVSLKEQHTIGIVGSQKETFYQLRSMLVELTTQHSYRDVHIVGLFDESAMKSWGIIRWLPHIWDESGQVRYIAFDAERRHSVCELLEDVLRKRRLLAHSDAGRKEKQVLPHFVILAENQRLLQEESIYEDLVSDNPAPGITTILLAESLYELPQTCQYIIDLTDRPYAYEREKYDERLYFRQDDAVHTADLQSFARKMAAIELRDWKAEAGLPSSITFLQGYGVKKVEDLDILNRWEHSVPHRTLEAPVGMMAGNKVFSLNVLDKDQAHGPHGLLAGTTGSGKSELLQTWILSMAVNYHPHDVNFVIIDYKGGGMSDLMAPLPHVVGKITNIDRNITRSLISLKSELKRRQRLFAECGVNNIEKYQKAYKSGEAKERLPHLIIVTDEFAELKKEEPEFMAELNSVATIGRTLGVHMLLATQKPAGVVTDQISANSRFRICMKVQDVADSREMLKHPDAARITQAGRAYIRVGEDEVFELFQSFYSSAEYTDAMVNRTKNENMVRIVGVTGNRINPLPKKKRKAAESDELTAVICHIDALCRRQGIVKMNGPWLPELPKWLSLDALEVEGMFDGEKWTSGRKGLAVPVGRYDIPAIQAQGTQYLDFMATGHFGIYGMPATGKTFFLKTVLTALGLCYTPKEVMVTVIDAGNWSLKEFEGMPHVREVILNQEDEKVKNFVKKAYIELEARKKAFQKHAVSSLTAYREAAAPDTPAIVIMIDQIKQLFEQYPEMDEVLNIIAASGASFGIYLIYTAHTDLGLSYKFTQLIKGAVTFQLPDRGDYTQLAGPVAGISIPNLPGRALMRGNPPTAFHTAVYADARSDTERHEQILALSKTMAFAWKGRKEEAAGVKSKGREDKSKNGSVETIPNTAGTEKQMDLKYDSRSHIPIGTYVEDMETAAINLSENYICLICGESREKNHSFLNRLENILSKKEENRIVYLNTENYQNEMKTVTEILNERLKNRNQNKKEDGFDDQKWLRSYMQLCILIESLSDLTSVLSMDDQKKLRKIFTKSKGLGVIILAAETRKKLTEEAQNIVTDAALKRQHAVIVEGNPAEFTSFAYENDLVQADVLLDADEAALIQDGTMKFIRCL